MKRTLILIGCVLIVAMAYAQSIEESDYSSLSTSLGTEVDKAREDLAAFGVNDKIIANNKIFNSYRTKFRTLQDSLNRSKNKIEYLERSGHSGAGVASEISNYINLVTRLEALQADYLDWLTLKDK
jgi:hypothetical protein